jgi:superfamily II DNA helicase RecQ
MGVPAYVVLSDAALQAVAEERPQSRYELARIRGVGPRTLAKFSDDLLRLAHMEPMAESHRAYDVHLAGLPFGGVAGQV